MGYCTEALSLMVRIIKETTEIKSLISGHFIDNPASGRVMEKCGFIATGDECFDEALFGVALFLNLLQGVVSGVVNLQFDYINIIFGLEQ